MSNSWFSKTETVNDYVPPKENAKKSNSGGNWPFYMKKGESTKIAFLTGEDDDIPVIHYHNLFVDGKPTLVACSNGDPRNKVPCHLCAYDDALPKDAHYTLKTGKKVAHVFTILDMTENKNDEGEVYPFRKRIRLSNKPDMTDIQTRVHEIQHDLDHVESLKYAVINVSRSNEEKAPGIGVLGSVIKSLDTDKYEDLEPYTTDEILEFFVTNPDEISEIAKSYPLEKTARVKVNR